VLLRRSFSICVIADLTSAPAKGMRKKLKLKGQQTLFWILVKKLTLIFGEASVDILLDLVLTVQPPAKCKKHENKKQTGQ